jgi:hypothetical protein
MAMPFPSTPKILLKPSLPPKIFLSGFAAKTLIPPLQRNPNFLCLENSSKIPRNSPTSVNSKSTKILPYHVKYFPFKNNSFLYPLKELNTEKYLAISKTYDFLEMFLVSILCSGKNIVSMGIRKILFSFKEPIFYF